MSEMNKTAIAVGTAVVLAAVAWATAPKRVTPDAFLDRGQAFFPEFADPNTATTLEVISYDEASAGAQPFKVTFKNNRWTIPSHHDYPADAKDRLAKTAASVIGITKDDYRGSSATDQEACGVIDPLDETQASTTGRGKRITLRGASDQVLADLIIGKAIPERQGYHFVRVPDQKRIYVAKADVDISTKFEDWIDKDLLRLDEPDIAKVVLKDYSINELTRSVENRDLVTLTRVGSEWRSDGMTDKQEVDKTKMQDLAKAIADLSIVGVRKKPAGLAANLQRAEQGIALSQQDLLSLQGRGYYITGDGQLMSNEGDVQAMTQGGVVYTMRFGEVVYGSGEAVTAGTEASDQEATGKGENRYLFLTAEFDPSILMEPPRPTSTSFEGKADADLSEAEKADKALASAHTEWQTKFDAAKARASELNHRFADWYYVISGASFDKLHLKRSDLVKEKVAS